MRIHFIIYFFTFGCCFFLYQSMQAQNTFNDPEKVLPKIYSTYMYHFAKYFLWPSNANHSKFTIGILEEKSSEITKALKEMAEKQQVNGQEIVIKEYSSLQNIDLNCHILFIPFESSNSLSDILIKTQSHPILVISAKEGLGKVGSPVNFVTVNGKPSFELNADALKKRDLKFAQQLKAIAIMI